MTHLTCSAECWLNSSAVAAQGLGLVAFAIVVTALSVVALYLVGTVALIAWDNVTYDRRIRAERRATAGLDDSTEEGR